MLRRRVRRRVERPDRLAAEEVVDGAFRTLEEIADLRERERFCPDGLEMFDRWRAERATG